MKSFRSITDIKREGKGRESTSARGCQRKQNITRSHLTLSLQGTARLNSLWDGSPDEQRMANRPAPPVLLLLDTRNLHEETLYTFHVHHIQLLSCHQDKQSPPASCQESNLIESLSFAPQRWGKGCVCLHLLWASPANRTSQLLRAGLGDHPGPPLLCHCICWLVKTPGPMWLGDHTEQHQYRNTSLQI